MALFSAALVEQINTIAAKSNEQLKPSSTVNTRSMNDDLNKMSKQVIEYFKDSPAILVTTKQELHDYVDKCIEKGYAGIDTETTGLDRLNDWIVGASLYTPGMDECYIPMKHRVPIFDTPYKNQLSYEDVQEEFQRLVDNKVKLIFANADFDLAMIYKDLHVDMIPAFYYDVILAWRCLKENELDNSLKGLYAKYPMRGKVDPKKFSDFFSPALFPYCKPAVAKLYAANDAKITYELFVWQLPYVTKDNPKCKKHHFEKIADIVWNIEFPMVSACALLHRRGVYLDDSIASTLHDRYTSNLHKDEQELAKLIQELIDTKDIAANRSRPFRTGDDFNPNSQPHVKYLVNKLLGRDAKSTGKEVLKEINQPSTNSVLKVRGDVKLIGTYVDKMPKAVGHDHRVHPTFKSIGAATGRMCIAKGTPITVLNGTKPIEDIKPGDLVYCYDENGDLHLSPVKNLWLTGKDRECVTIKWQSSGSGDIGTLTCTPEHLILKKDGEWCRADQLKRYDKLAHLRRTSGPANEPRPQLYGWNGLATREQDVIKANVFHAPSEMIIHHKDGDCSNNELSNLEVLTHKEHTKLHGKLNALRGTIHYEHLRNKDVRERAKQTAAKNYEDKTKARRDELIEAIHNVNGVISKVPYDFDSFKHMCEVAGVDYEAECKKAGGLRHKYRKPSDITESEFIEAYTKLNGDYKQIPEYLNISEWTFYQKCHEYNVAMNHMVQKVTPAGKFDVYDIEVETYHNFIASEICVHNSSESPNAQNIPSHATDIRHMFRATPELSEYIDVNSYDDSTVKIALHKIDSVKLADETLCRVSELKVSQKIVMKDEGANILAEVVDIADCLDNNGQLVITLKI